MIRPSVDVTGEHDIASQIAFGVSDRSALGTAVLAGVVLDIKHQAAENRILGPGGTPDNLSLPGHTLPLILPGQPLL
jgi:hypothetical protein